jgi:4-alpha-glucanotransferase
MGIEADAPGPVPAPMRVVYEGDRAPIDGAVTIDLEDGAVLHAGDTLPADLPPGYHTLRTDKDELQTIIVAPRACYFPDMPRAWGLSLQLYATRSMMSWGMGDLKDLRDVADWSKDLGAGLLMVSPLCASICSSPQVQPYSPCSRLYRNALYLRIEEIPGAAEMAEIAELGATARRLNDERHIDYEAVFDLKNRALERLWTRFGGAASFDCYCHEEGEPLDRFATFCALTERFGIRWSQWPQEFRHPASAAVERFSAENAERVRFRKWIQWLLDEQIRATASRQSLMMDLPIGFDPEGADAWSYQDLIAFDARIGAPPDDFNPNGQEWGLPPFIPHKLRGAAYRPLIETLRANLRHAGALRIDHVMGLSRLYWVLRESSSREGTYVQYPLEEMLAILAIESHRAHAWILGEDLGTVEDIVRARLVACRIPSYRLAYFENTPPHDYPPLSFAAVATHDLPTLAGLWSGEELRVRYSIGVSPHENSLAAMRARLAQIASLPEDAPIEEATMKVHAALARSPASFVVATLEDALGVREPPNRPGTTREWPNWSLALPLSLEEIRRHELPIRLAEALKR